MFGTTTVTDHEFWLFKCKWREMCDKAGLKKWGCKDSILALRLWESKGKPLPIGKFIYDTQYPLMAFAYRKPT